MAILLFHGEWLAVYYVIRFVVVCLVFLAVIVWAIQKFVAQKK
jgi:hypothetical protein